MAYPKKPPQLKIISGTTRKDRDKGSTVALPPVDEIPKPPTWLPNKHAKKEFDRLAGILFNNGLLLEGSVTALGHLAAIHGQLVSLWSAGNIPTGHMLAQYRNLMNDFGLSPVSATRIGGAVPVKKANAFSSNGKR